MKSAIQTLIAIILMIQISYTQDFGLALSFDGQDDYGIVPNNDMLNPGSSSWSMTCWIKAENVDQSSPIVMKRLAEDPYTQYSYGFAAGDPHDPQPGKRIRINHIEAAGASERSGHTTDEYIDGQWHHIAIVADKAQDGIAIYVDGMLVDFVSMYYFGPWPNINTSTELFIARGSGSSRLEGPVDELILWNRPLDINMVQQMMINPLPSAYYETADSGIVAYYRFEEFEDLGIGTEGTNDIRDLSSFENHMGTENGPELVQSVSLVSIAKQDRLISFELFPNPCSGALHLQYSISEIRESRIEVINISGSVLKTIYFENQMPGDHDITIDLSEFPAGMYFIRMQSEDNLSMCKIVKQ